MTPQKSVSTLVRQLAAAAVLTTPLLGGGPALAAGDVAFTADMAYPEGIAWSAAQKVFFVSSIHTGVVGKVTPDGKYTPFITDEKIVSSVGLHFDDPRNLLWVAIGDTGASKRSSPATQGTLAALAAYDAATGQRRAYHELGSLLPGGGGRFANDLAIDAAGNVYVTDSFAPVVYRIDAKGAASVFARSDAFKGEGFNLNGIVYHPDGYLLVGKYNSGELFRISTAGKTPGDVQRVKLSAPVAGADGIVLRGRDRISVVQNLGADQVLDVVSTDGWQSATLQPARKSARSFPTTAVLVGKDLYVLNAQLDTLFTKDAPKVSEYLLQKF
ncbi:MAG: gluconolaconase [Pseudomonadota bacterium]